jgi:hypothetical protein
VAFFSEIVTDGERYAAFVLMVLIQQRVGLEGPLVRIGGQIVAWLDAAKRGGRGVRIAWRWAEANRASITAGWHHAAVEHRVKRTAEVQRVSHNIPVHMPFRRISGVGGLGIRVEQDGRRALFGRQVQMVVGVGRAADHEKQRAQKPRKRTPARLDPDSMNGRTNHIRP